MAREQAKKRSWRPWLIAAGGTALFACTAMAGYKVHAYAVSDPQFALSREDRGALRIEGVQYASRSRVLHVFDTDFGRSVFAVSLAERRRRLMGIDWVEDAAVSRLWPNRLVVRVSERKPVAFVNLPLAMGTTRVLLIDANGVLLEPPAQSRFSFPVLSGITESDSEAMRRLRVRAMLRFLEDLGGGARDISEINAADLENIHAITQLDGRAVELLMGDGNYGRRYQTFLAHYPEIRKHSATGSVFDLRLDDRITAREQQ